MERVTALEEAIAQEQSNQEEREKSHKLNLVLTENKYKQAMTGNKASHRQFSRPCVFYLTHLARVHSVCATKLIEGWSTDIDKQLEETKAECQSDHISKREHESLVDLAVKHVQEQHVEELNTANAIFSREEHATLVELAVKNAATEWAAQQQVQTRVEYTICSLATGRFWKLKLVKLLQCCVGG